MFRSHPGEDRCNAVDGPGILFLGLIYLQTGSQPEGFGFAFRRGREAFRGTVRVFTRPLC